MTTYIFTVRYLALSPRSPRENLRLRLTPSVFGAIFICSSNVSQQQRVALPKRRALYPRQVSCIIANAVVSIVIAKVNLIW